VLDALLRLHPFHSVYLADLDALLGRGGHDTLIETLARQFPLVTFWVDQGARVGGAEIPNRLEVLGSESLEENWREILAARPARFILSLDFGAEGFLGPRELVESPSAWPETVILMTLQKVGAQAGPDIALLERQVLAHPRKHFIAAGGVRDLDDLRRLAKAGARGALLASALHGGSISTRELAEFA
jgi:phosphoribosylformimino-5-aminoimidazole carboxamide ribotide isomerase